MKSTRDKLKSAALSLFLERGYSRTSIGAIETAAGLAPRAGAFYRHFESKAAVALAIGSEDIVERPDEFDFTELLPLGDTRAELLLIARAYLKANKRQKKYYALIQEIRSLNVLGDFEQSANMAMLDWLNSWVASKRAGEALDADALSALTVTIFGGLLFFTTKQLEGISIPGLTSESFVDHWADHWATALDRPPQSDGAR